MSGVGGGDRRSFLGVFGTLGLGGTLLPGVLWARLQDGDALDLETIRAAERIAGLEFEDAERERLLEALRRRRAGYRRLREVETPNGLAPAEVFRTLLPPPLPAPRGDVDSLIAGDLAPREVDLPWAGVLALARLLRAGRTSSLELTRLALDRLAEHGPRLRCVVSLFEESALEEARRRDAELARGRDRGPLHGIPWGAKDLLAARGAPTTWGARPYAEQRFDRDAHVVERLRAAGAVLAAKLSTGALALGDVWYGGRTRNPWDPARGSSGSSAGPAAAVAAGLLPFAIGSETLGSIVSPSMRCGVTGLRPTFGRIGRGGAMALSWSMDKLGPMARRVEDCALVLAAAAGPDPRDPAARGATFPWPWARPPRLSELRFALPVGARSADRGGELEDAVRALEAAGARFGDEVALPDLPYGDLLAVLDAEAACAFDELTRGGGLRDLVSQGPGSWPDTFRAARMIPAVEHLRASRLRRLAMERAETALGGIDVLLTPSFLPPVLALTNLTGHPALVMPVGLRRGRPRGLSLVGRLWGEAALVVAGRVLEDALGGWRPRPEGF